MHTNRLSNEDEGASVARVAPMMSKHQPTEDERGLEPGFSHTGMPTKDATKQGETGSFSDRLGPCMTSTQKHPFKVPGLPRRKITLIAALAGVDPRSVVRVLLGQTTGHAAVIAKVKSTCSQLGVEIPAVAQAETEVSK